MVLVMVGATFAFLPLSAVWFSLSTMQKEQFTKNMYIVVGIVWMIVGITSVFQ